MAEDGIHPTRGSDRSKELKEINETLENIDLHLHRILATLEKIAETYGAIQTGRQKYTYTIDPDVRETLEITGVGPLKDGYEDCGRDAEE